MGNSVKPFAGFYYKGTIKSVSLIMYDFFLLRLLVSWLTFKNQYPIKYLYHMLSKNNTRKVKKTAMMHLF